MQAGGPKDSEKERFRRFAKWEEEEQKKAYRKKADKRQKSKQQPLEVFDRDSVEESETDHEKKTSAGKKQDQKRKRAIPLKQLSKSINSKFSRLNKQLAEENRKESKLLAERQARSIAEVSSQIVKDLTDRLN